MKFKCSVGKTTVTLAVFFLFVPRLCAHAAISQSKPGLTHTPATTAANSNIAIETRGQLAAPVGLLVNGVHNPLAIDQNTTLFTWRSVSDGRGARQSAYQVIVAASRERLAENAESWWNSGKMDSSQSASVRYTGKALPAATRFWWKVRIWDQTGHPSPYSTPAFFDTGLNHWKAQYIWDGTSNQNNFAYFRKAFTITHKPVLAKVYVTAQNDYLLYFNRHLLGMGPARCDPYHYGQYNSYDITKLVKTGTNVLAAMAHWLGTWRDTGRNGKPAFMLEARFKYSDGSRSTIVTNRSWKVLAHTPFIENPPTYFIGSFRNRAAIKFNSLLEPVGWRTARFDDSHWAAATVVNRSRYRLFAQMAPLEQEQAALKPVSITREHGAWLVNFGRCIVGWPELTMHQNRPGSTVRVQYYEMTGGRKPAGWDEYICRGGTERWDADFGRHTSFQVLKITGYAGSLKPSDVRGIWAYCDADVTGRFHCSSPLVNAIYKMCVRSAQQCVQEGIISTDANREQSPWLADSYLIGNVLLYNDRDTTIIDKVVHDYAGEQLATGAFRDCSPSSVNWVCAEWAMYWPMLLWRQYLFTGDQELLNTMEPRLTHFLQWIKTYQSSATKLLNPRTSRISDYAGGNMPSGGYNTATACEYYQDLRIASRIASVLGHANQSRRYARQASAVKTGINTYLFNGQYYLARTDRKKMYPLASAWALRYNIEPTADKSGILAAIEKAGKPDIGGYGGDAFYSGLLKADGGAFVVHDLARYRPMLESNKANWERFDIKGEVNHAWTSYPGYQFLRYFLGVQPTSGGFATFDVRPTTSGLTFAQGAVPTVKGRITVKWKKSTGGRFVLSVHVPANSRASIYIPKLSKSHVVITESGHRLWPAESAIKDPGVIAVRKENSSIKCLVDAGDYRFNELPLNSTRHSNAAVKPG